MSECAEGRNCVNIVEKGKERNSCRTAPRSLSRHEGRNPGSFRVSLANQTQDGSVGRPMGGPEAGGAGLEENRS